MRTRNKVCDDSYPHFMTCTMVGWLTIFIRPEAVQEVIESWCFLQRTKRLAIYGFVIIENRRHLIASSTSLAKEIGDFKSFVARKIIDQLETVGAADMLRQLKFFKAPN